MFPGHLTLLPFEFITQTLISVNYLAKKICSASNRKKAKINIGIVLSFSQ